MNAEQALRQQQGETESVATAVTEMGVDHPGNCQTIPKWRLAMPSMAIKGRPRGYRKLLTPSSKIGELSGRPGRDQRAGIKPFELVGEYWLSAGCDQRYRRAD